MRTEVVWGNCQSAQDGWILEGSQVKPEGQTDQITEDPDQKHTEGFKLLPKSSHKPLKALSRRKMWSDVLYWECFISSANIE